MSNKYYVAGKERAERVEDLFATIAPRYDLINDLQSFWLHRWWKQGVIKMAAPKKGEDALDLCCGTGDVAFALAEKGCTATGLDFSAPMLAVAEDRVARNPDAHRKPRFLRGDAQLIPFPDNSFDIVTISYGLRNLSSWKKGLAEMLRVARPGGRLLVLDFGKPDNAVWRSLYFAYLRWFVPVFGKLFCGDSQTHAYILESLQHYPAQHGVAAEMKNIGCSEVRIIHLLGGIMSINYGRKTKSLL
ncbi:MAG: ubiquinone/menaquinone biosynthesis methyltransferase [Verrucomicrobiales bacterium]|nr:ubiquinone/menaquinone biosynthesis methyltransferase [Verrucomicrobiales bacterium]